MSLDRETTARLAWEQLAQQTLRVGRAQTPAGQREATRVLAYHGRFVRDLNDLPFEFGDSGARRMCRALVEAVTAVAEAKGPERRAVYLEVALACARAVEGLLVERREALAAADPARRAAGA